ncbi:MAG: nucleoside deaminase [Chloroflexi bacterium]|jgi:tRNA(adenine34) deaminase|nr:nucleoside deaminase [Chloroflexota bacterium]
MTLDFDTLDHELYMREALHEAALAGQQGERPIGAVIVCDGAVVSRGRARHQERHSDLAHAELNALLKAERLLADHAERCVLYTTLEPCVMCLGAIVMSNIRHIVYGLADHWIEPGQMLAMSYVRRHIQHYLGGILERESMALWAQANGRELRLLLSGKRDWNEGLDTEPPDVFPARVT